MKLFDACWVWARHRISPKKAPDCADYHAALNPSTPEYEAATKCHWQTQMPSAS